jgi:tetratricopeptide (TPR) repeat protein
MTGDLRQLIDVANKLLPMVPDAWAEANVRYNLGRAQVQLSQPDSGLGHLQRARRLFAEIKDPWKTVECMDWEAAALYLLERPEALRLATEALASCRELSPVPVSTEVRILGHIAAIHTLHHEWQEAIRRYEEAIERAGSLRDLSRVGRMYNDLSIAYQQTGALAEAAAYLHKAVAVHQMQNDRQELAYSENNLASVLMEQGQLGAAERHLRVALTLFDELQLETRRSHVVLSLSELNIARGDFEVAERNADQALALATRNQEPMTAALAHQVLGQISEHRHDRGRADEEFSKAVAILKGMEVPERLIECHTKYAQILEDRGDSGLALQHLKAAIELLRPKVARSNQGQAERLG